jgi:hypothetical protein
VGKSSERRGQPGKNRGKEGRKAKERIVCPAGKLEIELKMQKEALRPFDTIESALEFMTLLEKVAAEASEELEGALEESTNERNRNGVRLAIYKIGQLSSHVHQSRRLLNDLMLIRGVLVGPKTQINDAS